MSIADLASVEAAAKAMDARPIKSAELNGELSPYERALIRETAKDRVWRESEEDWLYLALTLSARHRMRAGRLKPGTPDFRAVERTRQVALDQATKHRDALLAKGYEITPLLAEMLGAEGL